MAPADWPPLEPERRLARSLAEARGLVPPVDVQAVLSTFADIERDILPTGWDALVVRHPNRRPLVIVSPAAKPNRVRFTLAHELGHLVMPWQFGSALCHPDETSSVAHPGDVEQAEAEANRFAAELLLPGPWVQERLVASRAPLATRIIEIARAASVSPIAATIAMGRYAGEIAAAWIVSGAGAVQYVAVADACPLVGRAWCSEPGSLHALGGQLSTASMGPATLHAVVFDRPSASRRRPPSEHSSLVLEHILFHGAKDDAVKVRQQVNGIIGSANNTADRDLGALTLRLRLAFLGRPHLEPVVRHRRFAEFIEAKAYELVTRAK